MRLNVYAMQQPRRATARTQRNAHAYRLNAIPLQSKYFSEYLYA